MILDNYDAPRRCKPRQFTDSRLKVFDVLEYLMGECEIKILVGKIECEVRIQHLQYVRWTFPAFEKIDSMLDMACVYIDTVRVITLFPQVEDFTPIPPPSSLLMALRGFPVRIRYFSM